MQIVKFAAFAALMFSFTGPAAAAKVDSNKKIVELDMKLRFERGEKGKRAKIQESQPRVIARMGEPLIMSEEHDDGTGFQITVLSQEAPIEPGTKDRPLFLQFEISQIQRGKKVYVASPKLSVLPGHPARITSQGEDGSILDFTVTPTVRTE